ncbi:MAG TPA: arsenic transporter [Acholeplasmatales bacterium]|nr:arsenic transporter [Acholeplasmatales bacterium]
MILALILFIITYLLMMIFSTKREIIVIISSILFTLLGIINFKEAITAINYDALLIIIGTMGIVGFFIESKMPCLMADYLLTKVTDTKWAIVVIAMLAGIVSAFVDNVATVLMVAPIGLAICKKLNISPVNALIAISVSSNLQGAATLIGDTTSIILGSYANMNFVEFFFVEGKPSIFFAVELGAIVTIPVMLFLFRKYKTKIPKGEITKISDYFPTILIILNIVLLIINSFLPTNSIITNGVICIALYIIGIIYYIIRKRNFKIIKNSLKAIDLKTIIMLAGIFVVIAGITKAGLIQQLSNIFIKIGKNNIFIIYTVITFGSVFLSSFIDNIPYVATMLPVVSQIATTANAPIYLLYFGLLSGATLGGNLTPIGASANITTIAILKKEGYNVKLKDYFKIGIPFTLAAVITGYLYICFVWGK